MLGYLVEDLNHKGRKQEAKGIMIRNQVETHIRPEALASLADVVYDQSKDTSLQKQDAFEPLSRPLNEYMVLPDFVKVTWIGTEEDVQKMEVLMNDEFIGVDSEWRP